LASSGLRGAHREAKSVAKIPVARDIDGLRYYNAARQAALCAPPAYLRTPIKTRVGRRNMA